VRRWRNRNEYPATRFPDEERPEGDTRQGLTIVFTDLERIPEASMPPVLALWDALAASSRDIRLLNDPRTPKKRVPFLQLMQANGINDFAVYPIEDGSVPKPRSFPVFVREANDHKGPMSGRLATQSALEEWVEHARADRSLPPNPIVTEFVDTSDSDGKFRKYGAFRIGDAIVPAHMHVASGWSVKIGNSAPDPGLLEEEWEYSRSNPHGEQVMRAFRMASTEYGRMDYGMKDGRIQVFEINTCPTLLGPGTSAIAERNRRKEQVGRHLHRAFVALGSTS